MKYKVITRVTYDQEFIIEDKPFPPMEELGTLLTPEMVKNAKEAAKIAQGIMLRIDLEEIKPISSTMDDYEFIEVIDFNTGEVVYMG